LSRRKTAAVDALVGDEEVCAEAQDIYRDVVYRRSAGGFLELFDVARGAGK